MKVKCLLQQRDTHDHHIFFITNVQHVYQKDRNLFSVQHVFSFRVHGAEREHGVREHGGEIREELEEEGVHGRGQQVSVFRARGRDGVQHGVDDHVGVLEPALARCRVVLVGQVDVLAVEDLLALLVQFLPNSQTGFNLQDVGGLAEVTRLDDADLTAEKKGLIPPCSMKTLRK